MNIKKNVFFIVGSIFFIMIISCLSYKENKNGLANLKTWANKYSKQYESHIKTSLPTSTKFGGGHLGNDLLTEQKLDRNPWLKKIFQGCGFATDYRDRRGHHYMLEDQENSLRLTGTQSGACLHCHSSILPLYEHIGKGDINVGFLESCKFSYEKLSKELHKLDHCLPLSCIDCHDAKTMSLKITRPGFINGIVSLANSDSPVPFPSIEEWREGDRSRPYDPNIDASIDEKRSFVCAQCHVEYSCSSKTSLIFPWGNGLKADNIEEIWNKTVLKDGSSFFDFEHNTTGAKLFKAQHPEFEIWSQGYHAENDVSCADCHMPLVGTSEKESTDHWVRSPLLNISNTCCKCHVSSSEEDMKTIVEEIQENNEKMIQLAADELLIFIELIEEYGYKNLKDININNIQNIHRKAQWYLDFVLTENSMGFHAPEETKRLLDKSIAFSIEGTTLLNSLIKNNKE